jgi:hypothetical protein
MHLDHQHFAGPKEYGHHGTGRNHDHKAESDISLVEQLSASWTKLIPLLIVAAIAVLLSQRFLTRLRLAPTQPGKARHLEHWRPPLRAPPISL